MADQEWARRAASEVVGHFSENLAAITPGGGVAYDPVGVQRPVAIRPAMTWTSKGYNKRLSEWNRKYTRDDVKPDSQTLVFGTSILERQFDRALTAIDKTETKAALVIPAIGVLVGIIGPIIPTNTFQETDVVPWALGFAAAAALLSAALAMGSLWPRPRSSGPSPDELVPGMSEPLAEAHWHYFKSLAFAVDIAGDVAKIKGKWLSLSFLAGAASIFLLVLFVALGGLQP